jgi:hypothetical protein
MSGWKARAALAGIVLLFIVSAMLFVTRLGIEADEAMIANGIYARAAPWYAWTFGDFELPIMLINYLGALKTWLYAGVFAIWAPAAVSLRLPMVVAGAGSVWLFFVLLDRAAGRRAAWIGALLLATDTSFVLMHAADYGPVALQFLFKLGALVLLLHFHNRGGKWPLAAAFFLLGLALWDKAVFGWSLFGLALGAAIAFPRVVLAYLNPRNFGIAAASFLVGALPLVAYNIARPLDTFRSNVKMSHEPIRNKVDMLASTMNGFVLFGFFTAIEPGPNPGVGRHWYQSASLKLADWTSYPFHNFILPALALAVAALPVIWRTDARAPVLFALGAALGTWLPMALTAGAGASAQHCILVWPFHLMAIAVVLARAPVRVAWAAVAVLCLANLAVTNHYYAAAVRNGGAIRWTDAIFPLDKFLATSKRERIFVADWGILETINLLSRGETPVINVDRNDQPGLRRMLQNPADVFVARPRELAVIPEIRAAVEEAARREGFVEELVSTIYDRNGRATFEVFRFRKLPL